MCNNGDIGDECHYILYCTYLKQQQNPFLNDAYIYSSNVNISDEIKLKHLFNSLKMLFMLEKILIINY